MSLRFLPDIVQSQTAQFCSGPTEACFLPFLPKLTDSWAYPALCPGGWAHRFPLYSPGQSPHGFAKAAREAPSRGKFQALWKSSWPSCKALHAVASCLPSLSCSTHISYTESPWSCPGCRCGSQWKSFRKSQTRGRRQGFRYSGWGSGRSSSVLSWYRQVSAPWRPYEGVAALSCH